MEPLVQSFTKNLSGCSGCGQVPQSIFEAINKGEKVTFLVQIQVEAQNAGEAIQNISSGTVLSVNPRPQQNVQATQIQKAIPQPPVH